jgi:hypothetical protein
LGINALIIEKARCEKHPALTETMETKPPGTKTSTFYDFDYVVFK